MDNEIETKKINYDNIQKIHISPRNVKDQDIIIQTVDDTVYLKIVQNNQFNINSVEGW